MYNRFLQRSIAPAVTVATAAAACVCFTSIMDPTSPSTLPSNDRTMRTSTTLSRINVFQKNKTTVYRMANKITPTNSNGTNKKNNTWWYENVPSNANGPTSGRDEEEEYQRLFLQQLNLYDMPLWDDDWDGKKPKSSGETETNVRRRELVDTNGLVDTHGVTRHIILIRCGHHYDETLEEGDSQQVLTSIGREQAHQTGQRLAQLIKELDGPSSCRVKSLRTSTSAMARARETTQIIEEHLPDWIVRMDPDPNLNKGLPCHSIPVALIEKGHERMEEAFDSYFYRADEPVEQLGVVSDDITSSSGDNIMMAMEDPQHEIEIIVCHGDVIRYFFFRALQLHPQAWRPSYCSLTHLTVQPTGTVRFCLIDSIPWWP